MRVRWGRVFLALFLMLAVCGVVGLLMTNEVQDLTESVAEWVGSDSSTDSGPFFDDDDQADVDVPVRADGAYTAAPPRGSRPAAVERPVTGELVPFPVMTLQYTPYMATLALMAAQGYMEELGYELQLLDVYSAEVDLDEDGQCEALRQGEYAALATTLDAVRKCGEGAYVGIPIGQSAGNDAIVVKPGVETWNDVFARAIAFTGYSVSEYMACFASHTANAPLDYPLRYDEAAAAVDEWINAGAEQNIQSVVAWEPEVSRALEAVPDSRVILSSRDIRILWDAIAFSAAAVDQDPLAFDAFTQSYYRALLDLTNDPEGSLIAIVVWASGDPARESLLTTTDVDEFLADLDNEAFATIRDAAFLMDDRRALHNRLDEAAFYWQYCDVDVPDVVDPNTLIAPEFVLAARDDSALLGDPNDRPSAEIFQITDFTNAAAVTDEQIEEARVIFATGVEIEFMPNRTEFRDAAAAGAVLANAVRFLRTCQDCVLEVQGGAAYPGQSVCPGCRTEDSDQLAIDRGRRVYDELRARFDVPDAQLRFVEEPHSPQFPSSNDEQELRQDRRTFLTGYQLSGR